MIDDEGTLSTTDVKARFVNGKPTAIEARYNMRSQFEWDRFIRFMDRWEQQHPGAQQAALWRFLATNLSHVTTHTPANLASQTLSAVQCPLDSAAAVHTVLTGA